MAKNTLHYAYKHTSTEATTGYFSCEPEPELDIEACLENLAISPLDDFLHTYTLRKLMQLPLASLQELAQNHKNTSEKYLVLAVLLLECALLNKDLAKLESLFTSQEKEQAFALTPLRYLAWNALDNKEAHRAWAGHFLDNITKHQKLPHPEELSDEGLTMLFSPEQLPKNTAEKNLIKTLHAEYTANPGSAWSRPEASATAQRALGLLVENAILDGVEMRHEASLSPIALLRPWRMRMDVQCARNEYSVEGQATTYGRGLSLAHARASYAMEMIERASAYASIKHNEITGLTRHTPLFYGTYTELVQQGHNVLDPNSIPLEVPYANTPLYWIEAQKAQSTEYVLVPVQYVFLFSNLDEVSLMMTPGSTGLASGNSLAEAKVAALTEIIERDAEGCMPYDRRHCFTLYSQDAKIQSLLDDYAARALHVHFLDLTTEFGVPCYQAFLLTRKGEVVRATGANLSGAKAALSALTEVPYPYPHGEPSGPAIKGLPQRCLEELPDYTLESPTRNLALLEDVLMAHGHTPLYVEVSRMDLELPVVRAIVPELLLNPEPDTFSRVSPRLFRNYLKLYSFAG